MSKKKKNNRKHQLPTIKPNEKKQNPPTIMADNIYTIDDANHLAQINIFPIAIQGKDLELFSEFNGNTYYTFQTNKEYSYAVLDINEFLKNFDIESDIKLILTRNEILTIHHARIIKDDIVLCTDLLNINLSTIMIEILGKQEKIITKTYQKRMQ